MRPLPTIADRGEFDVLVVRTDYDDAQAWHEVATALTEHESHVHCVSDPVWAGATVDELLATVRADEDLSVVFLADRTTMRLESHALLAVTTLTLEDCVDAEDYGQLTEFGREFRVIPSAVHEVYANLSIGNLGFEEYAAWAHDDPEGIFRSF
ncbi:hypothetical protein ABZY45_03140 [Streptomyces sp. NPDC006516]|uniref:DUF6924 domain-containing protein n=1 Tax=Streptomyces sp. NPDC006516 TaxID=3154309 RepID=UPI0033B6420F